MKMNYAVILLLICMALFSCAKQKPQIDNYMKDMPKVQSNRELVGDFTSGRQAVQDSLQNEILKKGFLHEIYRKGAVSVSNDSLHFLLSFDLHSPDCGAPDCYATDVSFAFQLGDSLVFPQEIPFKEHEYGCIEDSLFLTGKFNLLKATDGFVVYHSPEHTRTLALFRSKKEVGTLALYYTTLEQNEIEAGIDQMINPTDGNYDEENYPFMSTRLTMDE